ncbi:MAG: AAA family ATPase [Rhodospirillum sp.]|nr:AAA family ATPase [Rhodospirillum sp.]MCF8492093.1 AAA family ATPase [Rhodospirillum sp.]MCF8501892.1 AAA family ATPase [Rhodospirillum sp.]
MDNSEEQVTGQELWRSREFILHREISSDLGPVLRLETLSDRPDSTMLHRMRHAHGLAEVLDPEWATLPLALRDFGGRVSLLLADPGGLPLSHVLSNRGKRQDTAETRVRLRFAIALANAVVRLHGKGLIHKNLNPDTILVAADGSRAWLTGFTLTTAIPREKQPVSTEAAIGSLAHAAPEQTGRMNRSVDTRSDLYSLGVVLFELFTGKLPFSARDPMEWVHCHVARPPPKPSDIEASIPGPVSNIILKLLSKMAEDRYQTADGLVADLTICLENLDAQGGIPSFPLGEQDNPGRLVIPEILYGRDQPMARLTAALNRAAQDGAVELAMVTGYSGVGKSTVINQLHALALEQNCLFGGGKFDQLKRDIPYLTFAQAFDSLVRRLLSRDDERVAADRASILEAVGRNGRLLTDLIPKLETLIGPQPPLPDLSASEAEVLFRSVFGRFVQVFARPNRPLVLALDDLQWIDAGSLRMLEFLTTHPDMRHLMIIGGYRANETSSSHPLLLTLNTIREAGTALTEVDLLPLAQTDLDRMVAESLSLPLERARPLAKLVHAKTGGNPFFVIQFLGSLVEEGLLAVDTGSGTWVWDMERIQGKDITDNVVDLMAKRLSRLPQAVQADLRRVACLGNVVELSTLALVLDRDEEAVLAAMTEALRAELVRHEGDNLAFLHDRVREAAYQSFNESERVTTHLRIGRILLDSLTPETLESGVFDVVHQLNQAQDLITDPLERDRLSRLNLIAGSRARASTAHASALIYFRLARDMLPEDAWSRAPERTFDLLLDLAESEYLAGNHEAAGTLFTDLLERAPTQAQQARAWRLRLRMFMVAGRFVQAVDIAVEALARFGLPCPETLEALEEAVAREQNFMVETLERTDLKDLFDGPECDDPHVRPLLGLIADIIPAVYHINPPLYPFLCLKGINLGSIRVS